MSNNKYKILIVEDAANTRSFIKANLETSDYQVICAETCTLGIMMYASHHPDLIILDLGLPDRDGLDLIQEVRESDTVPIIVLSARSNERDKVTALDLGANDYITKPFQVRELIARVNRILLNKKVIIKNFTFDINKMEIYKDSKVVNLTILEKKILFLLVENVNKVVTRELLIDSIWQWTGNDVYDNTITVYLKRIREKLDTDIIKTIKGVGYRIDEE